MILRRRSDVDLGDRLAAFEAALDLADGRLDGDAVADGRHVVDKAAERLRHGTGHTMVAFLGATGGGKSSLTNAVVGSDVATAGLRRPTTTSTLACYWGDDDPQPLLDWLEVTNRHHVSSPQPSSLEVPSSQVPPSQVPPSEVSSSPVPSSQVSGDQLAGLVLLDVPDHDSVELANRLEMERIAEQADLLVWVTDAEKYADLAMHTYLRQLREHGAVTAMVLNKADQLSAADVQACRADLAVLLKDDGLENAPIVVTSTTTGAGIGDLRTLLAEAVADRRAMVDRLQADIRSVADQLVTALGSDDGAGEIPKRVVRTLSSELVGASGLDAVCDAVAAGHRRDAAARTGWPFTRWVRSLRPHPLRRLHLGPGSGGRTSLPEPSAAQRARSEGAVRAAIATVTTSMPAPWPELVSDAATPSIELLNDRIDQSIAGSVRDHRRSPPRWWSLVNVLQFSLAAAAIVGAVWLGLLAFGAYLQLPDVPTPSYRQIPIPTGLLIGGILIGLLLAFVARRLSLVGGARRSRAVRRNAEAAVEEVAHELVITPMQTELDQRGELRSLLSTAGAR